MPIPRKRIVPIAKMRLVPGVKCAKRYSESVVMVAAQIMGSRVPYRSERAPDIGPTTMIATDGIARRSPAISVLRPCTFSKKNGRMKVRPASTEVISRV
jgi:hypothetical protein